ncbi:4-hydroxythreonine-4-phosphate dehydrogenase PdxA [Arthrobacter sp.]|uniref:4-hydroxythreonine-4-phosphate dehydrogenase PdxA n=1 Tax=Arthrobacter sp. TaxID=1667 RepID=UPI003A8E2F33
MQHVLAIADDFTGATETAAQFHDAGAATVIRLRGDTGPSGSAGVLVIDTHSRQLPAEEARQAVARRLPTAPSPGTVLFKKIDSLWRGNIPAELEALRAAGYRLVIAGALPEHGRTVVDGIPLVNGQALADTGLWQVEHRRAPDTVADALGTLATVGVALEDVRKDTLHHRLGAALAGHDAAIVDCETAADLDRIATAFADLTLASHRCPVALVGTGALARSLARVLAPLNGRQLADPAASPEGGTRALLAVVGSASPTAAEQVGHLEEAGIPVFRAAGAEAAARLLATGTTAALVADATTLRDPAAAHRELDAAVATALAAAPDADLVLTGGETARSVLDRLGINELVPLNQIQHGVVITRADDGRLVAAKPGTFGTPTVLTEAIHTLHALRGAPTSPGDPMEATTTDPRPFIAVTMGDGAGVGPEVTVGALLDERAYRECRPIVIGDTHRLRLGAAALGVTADIVEIQQVSEAVFVPGTINVIDPHLLSEDLPWGRESAEAGNAAYHYIRIACELGMAGDVQGICTAPLNKAALHSAGHIYPGHTELLAHFMGVDEVSMMLSTPKVKVIHVTTHVGLIDAIARIEPGLVERTVRRGHEALVRSGIANPKIGVCAINPHAGENGLFGYGEEEEKIIPALEVLTADGINAIGPLPADTAFFLAGRGDYDLIVAMYHDQGHGPVKVLGIEAGVNITVGLPVIRTSVDHGTAFDIAGTGVVEVGSMIEALHQASNLSPSPVH